MMTAKLTTFLSLSLLAFAMLTGLQSNALAKPLTVVELYTSQGCSSCPPADAYLGELAKRDDVLPLAFHVDYWDYIGWKDTNALALNSTRQRDYARQFGLRYVYTPQMVIQGTYQTTGSDKGKIRQQITDAQKTGTPLPLTLAHGANDALTLTIPASPASGTYGPARILFIGFDREQPTKINRGENRGKTIRYHNIVRHIAEVGNWTGDEARLSLTISDMKNTDIDACAVLLQEKASGKILGAARLDLR